MRLLLDENVPIAAVRALRAAGHDVFSASEHSAGAADEVLLARADAEHRLLITFDRDFGELAVRWGRGAAGGVILLRFVPRSPDEVGDVLVELLARTDVVWSARFSVVDRRHIRQRPL
jgi:predicted nuclease of predicted toxin-antitoxin system